MGKLYRDLYDRICHTGNLWLAFISAARGKRYRPPAAMFEFNLERNLIELEQELRSQTWQPGGYHNFQIHLPKRRLISAAPFRDRVVHHALMNVIEPLFERQFIFDSYANRKGKGTHLALDRCTYFLRRHSYVMHCDVRQFFPSIDHEVLLSILSQTLADDRVMGLISRIIQSGEGIQNSECLMVSFPGDDLFSAVRPRGLPIGNLTSQHWANVYLNELDQFVKRSLKCRAYIRYVDDLLLFADQKDQLNDWLKEIYGFLTALRLTLHPNRSQPRPARTGVPFLGFHVFPDHRLLKHANGYSARRRYKALRRRLGNGAIDDEKFSSSLQGWINHARYGDTWGLRRSIFQEVISSNG